MVLVVAKKAWMADNNIGQWVLGTWEWNASHWFMNNIRQNSGKMVKGIFGLWFSLFIFEFGGFWNSWNLKPSIRNDSVQCKITKSWNGKPKFNFCVDIGQISIFVRSSIFQVNKYESGCRSQKIQETKTTSALNTPMTKSNATTRENWWIFIGGTSEWCSMEEMSEQTHWICRRLLSNGHRQRERNCTCRSAWEEWKGVCVRGRGGGEEEETVVILTTWKVCAQTETQVHVHLLLLDAI